MIDPRLKGKVVLVTGANHGIGAATARAFGAQGCKVFITFYRPPNSIPKEELKQAELDGSGGVAYYTARQQQPANKVLEALAALGADCRAWEADLGEAENIPRLFERCEAELGAVDVLVNNHTHCVMETFDPGQIRDEGFAIHLTTADSIDRHFMINARAYALLMAEYTRRYLARNGSEGRIINLSTDAAHAHTVNISYAASKHAIESYSRSAAAELGKYGITVNIAAPGPIQTGYITPVGEDQIAAGTPLGRVGLPEDVADVIVFLASYQARWLTGQLIYVGGGWRMSQ